ncbi:unnamed protein product [Gordionus sp. m RMFG-2023]
MELFLTIVISLQVWLVYSQPNLQPLPISPFFSPPFGQIPLVNPFLSIGFSENLNPLIGHPDSLSIGPPFYVFDNFIDQDKCSDIDQGCACLSEYRTFDGTCNNVKHSKFGSTFQPLLRILSPNYGDGKSSFRRSQSGSPLPNARKISLLIHGLPDMLNEFLSIIAMQWGQMVDHEMNFVPATKKPDGSRLACCGADSSNTQCAHIDVKGDPFYGEFEVVCIGFTRSEISNISSRMLLMTQSPVPGGKSMLLLVKDAKLCDGQEKNGTGICTAAGDLRANENIGLTILQTIFAREHNRIADHLNKLNRQWSDETIYQETRKIIGAFIQHIQFNEFLPIIVGQDIMNDFGLTLNSCGYFAGYDSEIEATVHTEFSTAAYRFGHSLIPMQLNFLDDSFTPLAEPLLLRDAMLNPLLLYQFSDFNVFDSLLRSLIFDNAQKLDQIITGEVRNHLFELAKAKFGMDLPALNTMRGRDHGIPGYIQYRKACGLSPVNSFIDLVGVIPNSTIGVVRNLYRSVNDMDLFPLGLSEFPLKGAMLGPTFACILGIQFKALKFGDSFWYENIRPRRVFTRDQLKEIRKISLAKIICQNADDIPMIPRNIFLLVDSFRNPFIDCSRLASTDLSKWRVNDS